jgi:hypothetical protein
VTLALDSKIYVNGGFFSLLRYPAYPALLAPLGIAAVLEMPFQDTMQDHAIRMGLRGPDMQELPLLIEAHFRTAPSLDAQYGEPQIAPFG